MTEMFVASTTALLYMLGCRFLGYRYPFDRFRTYAGAPARQRGAIPFVRSEGRPTSINRFVEIADIDPTRIDCPRNDAGCSVIWVVEETRRWILEHSADASSDVRAADRVPLEIGYTIVGCGPAGAIETEEIIVATGTGRRSS